MKKTEEENEELKEKLKTLEESSVSENWLKFVYSYKRHWEVIYDKPIYETIYKDWIINYTF